MVNQTSFAGCLSRRRRPGGSHLNSDSSSRVTLHGSLPAFPYPLFFHTLEDSFALTKKANLFFSCSSPLFAKNTGGGVGSRVPILIGHLRNSLYPKKRPPMFPRSYASGSLSSFFSANSVFSVPSALNPSFSFNCQLSNVDLFPTATHHEIGFPSPHPIKSPHRPNQTSRRTGQDKDAA